MLPGFSLVLGFPMFLPQLLIPFPRKGVTINDTFQKNDFYFTHPKGHLYSQVGVSLFKVVTADVHENRSSLRAGTLFLFSVDR